LKKEMLFFLDRTSRSWIKEDITKKSAVKYFG
jgi:hypothetical protein